MTAAAARARSVPNQVYVGAAPGRGDAGHRLIAQASTGSQARSQKVVRSLARDVGLGTTRRRVVLDVLILEVPGGR